MAKNNKNHNHKSSPSDKAKSDRASYNKGKKSKQGKMDLLNPFSKILIYETESESEHDNNSDSDGHESDHSDDAVTQSTSTSASQSLSQIMTDSVGSTGHNILMASLKNKGSLLGVDLGEILTWKQGSKGSKNLTGPHLKKYKSRKQQKMSIAQICRAGIHLAQMSKYLESKAVHLNAYQEYVEMSSDIVSHICWILEHVAFMENVDNAAVLEYFNRRFADLRNRGNYVKK